MSREAYIEVYGQEPPSNAHFGADISYWQDSDVWGDLINWAEFVNIRCSYGRNSSDGKQNLHVQWADAYGYQGKLGGYHFYYAGNPSAQADNYLYQSSDIRDRLSHHMVDAEAAPIAGIGELEEWCQIVEGATGQPCIIYSGWSYLNGSGVTGRHLWLPHYASRSYTAWNGTPGSWDSWNAPYTPDWYGQRNPTVWQFTSLTNRHGHLDLNIGTEPMAQLFGLGQASGELFTVSQYEDIMNQLNATHDLVANNLPNWLIDSRTQVATVYNDLATQIRRSTRMRLIQAKGAWWYTDLIGRVSADSSEQIMHLNSIGFFNNDLDAVSAGNPIAQVWEDDAFDMLIDYEGLATKADVAKVNVTLDPQMLKDALVEALKDLPHLDADAVAVKVMEALSARLAS